MASLLVLIMFCRAEHLKSIALGFVQTQSCLFFDLYRFQEFVRIPVKTVSHFGFIRSLHNLLFSQLSFYAN
jgi:hypothetical protein